MVAIASIFMIVCGKADSLKSIEIFQMNPRTIYRNSVLVLSYVAWPAVARQAFEVMHCTTINGRRYLSADLRVSCDDNTYASYMAWAMALLAFFIPVFPLGLFALLWRNQQKIKTGKKAGYMTPEFRNKYRFLFEGLRPEIPYWELMVMCRKLIFTGTLTLLAHQRWLQLPACLCVMAAIFGTHAKAAPYKDWWKGALETIALFALMISLLLGCALTPLTRRDLERRRPGSTQAASILFIAVHIPVLMLFVLLLWAELMHVSKTSIERFAMGGSYGERLRAKLASVGLISNSRAKPVIDDDLFISSGSDEWHDVSVNGVELPARIEISASEQNAKNPLHPSAATRSSLVQSDETTWMDSKV